MTTYLGLFVLIAAAIAAYFAVKGIASNAVSWVGASCITISVILIVMSLLSLVGGNR